MQAYITNYIRDTGLKTCYMLFWRFVQSYSTLHLLQNTSTESKYLVSN